MTVSYTHLDVYKRQVFFKTDAVWMFLDFTAIGDQETVIFQEVVDPQVRDVLQVGNTFCGEEAPQLIVCLLYTSLALRHHEPVYQLL